MGNWYKSGSPWIWLTSGAVSISLIAVLGLLALIAWRGLTFFWPAQIWQFEVNNTDGSQQRVIGEIYDRTMTSAVQLRESGVAVAAGVEEVESLLVKTGNREYVELDFRWILTTDIASQDAPSQLAVIERTKNGNFYGYIDHVTVKGINYGQSSGQNLSQNSGQIKSQLTIALERVKDLGDKISHLQQGEIGRINYQLERLRLSKRRYQLDQQLTAVIENELRQQQASLSAQYQVLEAQLFSYRDQMTRDRLVVRDMRGELVTIDIAEVLAVDFPNLMSTWQKTTYWLSAVASFVSEDPREANTEGGVFPAIFGTIFMVVLMAVIVTPFGVVAAIYLHEYAKKGPVTKFVRIAVINLAGVPSVVYGVFGLGFFVYVLGGSIDALFYPESSPAPVFGTPGVLWSALTLAILTLPVVIVSTEEGLSRIPSSLRQGSLALGATKAETLWKIIIPMASPAIMTGLILAVARAAGEVAPLMLVGVVKMAPTLPIDGNFPFIHVDRKFMHLGFHIYDVGFQSPNVEAARPLVFATAFLLVTVIISLNISAIGIRNHLREKYRSLEG